MAHSTRFTRAELEKYSEILLKQIVAHMRQEDRKSKHQPPLVEGAVMRDYQLEGLDWLVALDNCGASGILADEMGLGKTLQVISLISFLLEEGNGNGDHFLVIAPLSAVQNWIDEFKKFAPKVPVILFYGPQEKRLHLEKEIFIRSKVNDKIKSFPVVITTFDTLLRDSCLQRINWRYLVIDEGQRIKNPEGILIKELRKYTFSNGCILTGTPVQNNMTELWSLLDFLHPKKIPDLDVFLNWFDDSFLDEANDNVAVAEEDSEVFSTLHKILKPFLLRRIKADAGLNLPPKKEIIVYATFTKWQERIYSAIVDKTLDLLQGKKKGFDDPVALCRAIKRQKLTSREEYKNETEPERPRRRRAAPAQPGYYYWLEKGVSMDSIQKTFQRDDCNDELVVDKLLEGLAEPDEEFITDIKKRHPMQALRLICSHPYTVSYPVIPGTKWFEVDERVVERSGKMKVLDAMLKRLKSNGHKVLIFSVFTKTLDVIEAYLEMRGYIYTRLDGTRNIANRQENIKKFNSDDDVFVFLISTRAGGLGINLVAADTVILYDSDWNPQVDLQAQDRCHRIGQTKPVAIYRFISKGTFDERLIEVAERKKQLDKIVVQHGKFHNWKKHEIISVYELKELLQQAKILNKIDPSTGLGYTDEELDALCDRAAVFGTATNEEYVKYESQDALAAGFNTAIKKEYVIDESQDTLAAGYNTAIKEEYVIDESEDALSGVTYPCIHAVWARWAPPAERSRLATIAFSGSYAGTVVSLPLSGVLAAHLGWPSIFYVFGVAALVWYAFWLYLVKENPEDDPQISYEELHYIQSTLASVPDPKLTQQPWGKFLTSMPVWAIVAAHFSENWGFYTLLTQLPTFMKDVLHVEIEKSGLLSALPYICMSVILQAAGHLADWLRAGRMSTTAVRKLFNCGAFLSQTIFMMVAAYMMSSWAIVLCLTIAVGLGGFAWSAFSVNHLDIAPQYASILMGISNTVATLPGMISPHITGYIVQDKTPAQWRIVFMISSTVYLIGALIYGIFASGERQSWAVDNPQTIPNKIKNEEHHAYINETLNVTLSE